MLTIRLQRAGKRNRPDFRIVLAEQESSAEKKVAEILGHYNPRTKEFGVKEDRVQYWVGQHVAMSPTIHNLFVNHKLISGNKVKAFSIPQKPTEPEVSATPASPEPVAESTAENAADAAAPATAEQPKEPTAEASGEPAVT